MFSCSFLTRKQGCNWKSGCGWTNVLQNHLIITRIESWYPWMVLPRPIKCWFTKDALFVICAIWHRISLSWYSGLVSPGPIKKVQRVLQLREGILMRLYCLVAYRAMSDKVCRFSIFPITIFIWQIFGKILNWLEKRFKLWHKPRTKCVLYCFQIFYTFIPTVCLFSTYLMVNGDILISSLENFFWGIKTQMLKDPSGHTPLSISSYFLFEFLSTKCWHCLFSHLWEPTKWKIFYVTWTEPFFQIFYFP